MLAGHEDRGNLHVIAQIRALDGVAQADLDRGSLDLRSLAHHTQEHGGGGMVAQVLTRPWQVVQHRDTHAAELCRRTNTGEQEQVWRANGATAQHDFVTLNSETL